MDNGAKRGTRPDGQALGDVARDVIDHVSIIARDRFKIGKLEARRQAEHWRRDVAPRAAFGAVAALLGGMAAVMGLVALFLGIAAALGSVAWTFAIYCGFFVILAFIAAGLAARRPVVNEAELIERRFPSVQTRESYPAHQLTREETPEAHRIVTREAQEEQRLLERSAREERDRLELEEQRRPRAPAP
jgi:hypothetical protein